MVRPTTKVYSRTMSDLLAVYDDQLRTDAETSSADTVTRMGPLWLATFAGGRGLVTYRDLDDRGRSDIRSLVSATVDHYSRDPKIRHVEWKTRGHDKAPGLHDALVEAGFAPGEPESIMLGPARTLAVDVRLPDDVTLRRVEAEADGRAMSEAAEEAFGEPVSERNAENLLRRLKHNDGVELWVAEADGKTVGVGRLEPVADSDFAGIWGGAIRQPWRGRGIYRALTAARARSAIALGRTLIHSDSTEHSRPILERSGLTRFSTTTPYTWLR